MGSVSFDNAPSSSTQAVNDWCRLDSTRKIAGYHVYNYSASVIVKHRREILS
jgi:hypothetical protein